MLNFFKKLHYSLKRYFSVKECSRKGQKFKLKPWISYRMQRMMKTRDRLLRKMKKHRSSVNCEAYRIFRNRVAKETRNKKKTYYQNYFITNFQNMNRLWSAIKSIISDKSFASANITKIIMELKHQIQLEIPNVLNDYFASIAENLSNIIPKTRKSPVDYLIQNNPKSMFIQPVTHIKVEDTISSFDSTKSVGPNSIPVNLLKIVVHHISLPIAKIINQSFITGVISTKLKVAKVVSLFKEGDPEFASDYRPILLLPISS